jgi:hypothetical protein
MVEDETLALRLLAGFARDGRGQATTQYLKSNSRDERLACAALARIVRDHVPGFPGELLALALDPHTASRIPGMKATRRVRFESPARGKPSTWARDLLVIDCIRTELFRSKTGKLEAAIKAAMDHFTISRATAQSIWRRYEKLVGRN